MFEKSTILKELSEDLNSAKLEIFSEKNPQNAVRILEKYSDKTHPELIDTTAYAYFMSKEYEKAASLYEKLSKKYHQGYCLLLLGDNKSAKRLWKEAPKNPAVLWGICLLDYIELKIEKRPTYLQIRSFLEKDIGNLIRANQSVFAENIANCSDFLAKINPESYKLIGRALFFNNFKSIAAQFFSKSQNLVDNDPEIYYYLSLYCFENKDIRTAKVLIDRALSYNSNYLPAKKLFKEIHKY